MLAELHQTLLTFINVLFTVFIFYYVVYKNINNINYQIIYTMIYPCTLFLQFGKDSLFSFAIGTLCGLGIILTTSYILTKIIREYAKSKEQVIHPVLLVLSFCFFATIMFFNVLGFVGLILVAMGK